MVRTKSLLDNSVTFSVQMQLVLKQLHLELSKYQVQTATLMATSINRYMTISSKLIPRREKQGAELAVDESMLSGSFHLRLEHLLLAIREPKTRDKEHVQRKYLTCLRVERVSLHHIMEQPVHLSKLPKDGFKRQFVEDRDIWVKQLYGRFLDAPTLRRNTTSVSVADLSIRAQTGRKPGAKETPAEHEIILLQTNFGKYHLPADTPVVHLEYSSFFRKAEPAAQTKSAKKRAGSAPAEPPPEDPIPPPCLYGRVHPIQVFFKQDAVMQFVRFAESCRLGSRVVGPDVSSSAYEKLSRAIANVRATR